MTGTAPRSGDNIAPLRGIWWDDAAKWMNNECKRSTGSNTTFTLCLYDKSTCSILFLVDGYMMIYGITQVIPQEFFAQAAVHQVQMGQRTNHLRGPTTAQKPVDEIPIKHPLVPLKHVEVYGKVPEYYNHLFNRYLKKGCPPVIKTGLAKGNHRRK